MASRGSFDYNIETKSFPDHPEYTPSPEEFVRLVLASVRPRHIEKRIILQSFDFRTLLAMRRQAPEIRLSALTETDPRPFAAIAAEAGHAEIVSPEFHLVTAAKVEAAHQAGLQVAPWTANQEADWDRLIAARVDAIITDNPAALIAYSREKACAPDPPERWIQPPASIGMAADIATLVFHHRDFTDVCRCERGFRDSARIVNLRRLWRGMPPARRRIPVQTRAIRQPLPPRCDSESGELPHRRAAREQGFVKRRFWQSTMAVLAGNAVYFSTERQERRPERDWLPKPDGQGVVCAR